MKKFLKVLMWIVILVVICLGIYTILPNYPKNFVKSFVQPVVNSEAKARINAVKNLTNQDVDATYEMILEPNTSLSFWVYEKNETDGTETVSFYGNGAYINIEGIEDHNDMLYTDCSVKFDFVIKGNTVKINAYIDNVAQDDVIKEVMIEQLKNGKPL